MPLWGILKQPTGWEKSGECPENRQRKTRSGATKRAQLEREKVRLEKAIDRLMDQIEIGQSVKDRLKLREEGLAQVKDRIAQADEPAMSRDLLADRLKPLGPLCALGAGDPVAIR